VLKRILNSLLVLTIFLVPVLPAYFDLGYEQIKVLCYLILLISAGTLFTYFLFIKQARNHWSRVKITALAFLVILSVTSFAGIHPLESVTGKFPYFQGLILYWFLFLMFLIVSELSISWSIMVKGLTGAMLVVSGVAIYQFVLLNVLNIQITNYAGRVISTFGQPNLYSGFLLLGLPLVFRENKRSYVIAFIIIVAIILSFSKAAILLLVGLIFGSLIYKARTKVVVALILLLAVSSILLFSVDKFSGIIREELITPLSLGKNDTGTADRRVHILTVMLEIYSKNPISGFGIDSIDALYRLRYAGFSPETIAYSPVEFHLKNLNIDRSHSYLLDLLIFSGPLGLLSYIYLGSR